MATYRRRSSGARSSEGQTPRRRLAALLRRTKPTEEDRAQIRRLRVELGELTPARAAAQIAKKTKKTRADRAEQARYRRLQREDDRRRQEERRAREAERRRREERERRRSRERARAIAAELARVEDARERTSRVNRGLARRARALDEQIRRARAQARARAREVARVERARRRAEEEAGRLAREIEDLERSLAPPAPPVLPPRPIPGPPATPLEARFRELRDEAIRQGMIPPSRYPLGEILDVDSRRWRGIRIVVPVGQSAHEEAEIQHVVDLASRELEVDPRLPEGAIWLTSFQFTAYGERLVGSGRVSRRVEGEDFQTHGFESTGVWPTRTGMVREGVPEALDTLVSQGGTETFVLVEYANVSATVSRTTSESRAWRPRS